MQGTGLIGVLGQVHWMPDLGLSGCKVLEKVYILGRMCWAGWRYWAGRVPCVQLYWAGWEYLARGTDLSVCTLLAGYWAGGYRPVWVDWLVGWKGLAGWTGLAWWTELAW